jgi:serine/threonine protein kinase
MACVEKKDAFGVKESYLLMEASEQGAEMDRYLLRGFEDFRKRRLFIQAFARWLSRLHEKDLYHRDMKTCNIVVSEDEEGWKFCLLDLEDVRLNRKVGEKDLFFRSTPRCRKGSPLPTG